MRPTSHSLHAPPVPVVCGATHCEQSAPVHWSAHVHWHVAAAPPADVTLFAFPEQCVAFVHGVHTPDTRMYPAAHPLQSFDALNRSGHVLHVAPVHSFRHVQSHVFAAVFSATFVAWLLQSSATSHVRHGGSCDATAHELQFPSCAYTVGSHVSHDAPVQKLLHSHSHLSLFTTAVPRPLQLPASVHGTHPPAKSANPAAHDLHAVCS